MMVRRFSLFFILLIFGVACSKAAAPSGSGTPSPAASSSCASLSGLSGITDKGTKIFSGATVALQADNDSGKYYFEPTCARAHGTVTVTIKNVGDTEHNFSITSMNIDKDIEKGKTVTVSVPLPSSGSLPFFCKYHKNFGMQGVFITS